MHVSFAPLEGITTSTYRKVFRRYFGGIDLFYTPFLAANHNHKFRHREKNEYLPCDDVLVPQVLTSSSDDFLWAAGVLHDAGYYTVNLNAGCPSSTVITKHKGAGMLADKERFDEFLYSVFDGVSRVTDVSDAKDSANDSLDSFSVDSARTQPSADKLSISIKTRIGAVSHEEVDKLIKIWSKYPISELIIHPRAGSDLYNGTPDMDAFRAVHDAFKASDTLITYNGELRTAADVDELMNAFPDLDRIMIGRGLLINPSLADEIRGGNHFTHDMLDAFLDDLWKEYEAVLSGPRDILFKMKELWFWLGLSFPNKADEIKEIRKTNSADDYKHAVKNILRT